MKLTTYPLPYLILGGALASSTQRDKVLALGPYWIDNADALELWHKIKDGRRLDVGEWLQLHGCSLVEGQQAYGSMLCWAETVNQEHERRAMLAELQTKTLKELRVICGRQRSNQAGSGAIPAAEAARTAGPGQPVERSVPASPNGAAHAGGGKPLAAEQGRHGSDSEKLKR